MRNMDRALLEFMQGALVGTLCILLEGTRWSAMAKDMDGWCMLSPRQSYNLHFNYVYHEFVLDGEVSRGLLPAFLLLLWSVTTILREWQCKDIEASD